MLERILHQDKLLALIIRSEYKAEGIQFFTPDDFSQQLGYMNRKKGYVIPPHVHNLHPREVLLTQEVLYIKSGRVRVDFYADDRAYLNSREVVKGDIVLLAQGGHGFEMLEDSEIIEVKQGPYCEEKDKIRFQPAAAEEIRLDGQPTEVIRL